MHLYFVIFKNKKDKEYKLFSNNVFDKEKDWISSFMEMLQNHVYVTEIDPSSCFAALHKNSIELLKNSNVPSGLKKTFTSSSKSKLRKFDNSIDDGWKLLDWHHEFYRQGVFSDESESSVSPFIDGVFLKSVKSPILTASLSGSR